MSNKKPVNGALLALTASALAIPGMSAPAHAQSSAPDAMPEQNDKLLLDYRYSGYREGDIPASKTANGQSSHRYDVDSNQFRTAAQLDGKTDLTADVTIETMSGASPWFVLPGVNGKPLQVMSGASIHDFRQGIQLRTNRRFEPVTASLLAGYSHERDYSSANGGMEGSWDFNDKLTTLSGGAGYTGDQVNPTEGQSSRFPTRIKHATAYEINSFVGVSQVLTRETEVQTSLSYTYQNGYLSDPYKLVYVGGITAADNRPANRHKLAWTTRLRQDVPLLDASVHLDYRYFRDDWGVVAHTVDLAWYQTLPDSWAVVPRLRWYSQSQANFYQPYYNAARGDGYYSSDYRLSPFGSLSESLAVYKRLGSWNLSLRYEHYDSGAGYSLRSVDVEAPGLVRFQVFSAGIAKTF
ncbi:MAG: DUF3570 domain-containing protein [Nevskia sp.]|nr:DUF3570 domain-containing protein [Nevskia sp.]